MTSHCIRIIYRICILVFLITPTQKLVIFLRYLLYFPFGCPISWATKHKFHHFIPSKPIFYLWASEHKIIHYFNSTTFIFLRQLSTTFTTLSISHLSLSLGLSEPLLSFELFILILSSRFQSCLRHLSSFVFSSLYFNPAPHPPPFWQRYFCILFFYTSRLL